MRLTILLTLSLFSISLASGMSNHYAILVETSNYFRNFRHVSNTLTLYHLLIKNGIPKENLLLMIADPMQCNSRNPHYGEIITQESKCDLMENTFVAYSHDDVSLAIFLKVLLNDLPSSVSTRRRLNSNKNSTLLIFLNGHGGENFIKFQEKEELNNRILSNVLFRMFRKGRYGKVLVIIDTCQAASLIPPLLPPFSSFLASSRTGEESFSFGFDLNFGVPTQDRFTALLLKSMKGCEQLPFSDRDENTLLQTYFKKEYLRSTAVWRTNVPHLTHCAFFGYPL